MNSKRRRRLLDFRLRWLWLAPYLAPDLVLVTGKLWRLLALRNAFLHEKTAALSGLLVFTGTPEKVLMELLQASVAARSGVSSKLRTLVRAFSCPPGEPCET